MYEAEQSLDRWDFKDFCVIIGDGPNSSSIRKYIAHAAAKRELIAKHRPAGSMPPNMFQFPKVLTEAEVIEAEEELMALQRHAFGIVDPKEQS